MCTGQHQAPGDLFDQYTQRSARLCAVVTAMQWYGSGQPDKRSPGQQRFVLLRDKQQRALTAVRRLWGDLLREVCPHVRVP